ncbi:UDP-glucose 4-epimerase isoform X1 [Heterocephalus glaber]|uniref:UDP-N-acetylglucosamine 4-epimerase n=1 Tax=Heterocephalus glaber TaxID=10181 RepID=A0AAX6TF64_HETGA|nr:UDP-glucose 4-epimerase isoform X1 [Heterocephalus glaber]XP_021118707.1 UDP-glucose 4-epimerase isoform X1 [Heterocephalus glaber]XP_021118708.1 UDP-glucose 4-epimerase isoform X1 [Heterocephalus glaber]XP_021118709.1 UDP-glucose 4-epimerase isoform X1 [Heterocephalus glaber]XP_021118710.1 UDP-glucose 4-epimerase isoform X1 [Heterocephalus glaber]XP_021118711.1 UDP-glucose 4-epimerase isoform X1 [Heterocephalus glaber]
MAEKVLVTGGAGYIGSHTVLELLEAGYSPMVIDNFHNAIRGRGSMPESLRRVQELTGCSVEFEEMDILDKEALQHLFKKHSFKAVIHFAGLKAVGESVQKPLDYYRVNLTGTIQLLEIMRAHGVKNLVFSSSATVYGNPQYLPLDEAHPTGSCTNPYGKSKFFIEEMIQDLCRADKAWNAVLLRYFNPTGAHASGCIGEDPQGIPNNLMPYISQVAIGRREALNVFGNDYDTEDGTGIRDYIHVVDLAKGHIAALRKLKEQCGCRVYNLGTGKGYSVLQMVQAMEKASGRKVKTYGAGRSRIHQVSAHRLEDRPSPASDHKGKEKQLSALQTLAGPQTPALWGQATATLPQTPAGPTQPTRQVAEGSTDQKPRCLPHISCRVQEGIRTTKEWASSRALGPHLPPRH